MTQEQGPRQPLDEMRAEIARLQSLLAVYQDVERRILTRPEPHSGIEMTLVLLDGDADKVFRRPDHIERFMLERRAVEVLRKKPDIDRIEFAWLAGLYEENDQIGLAGWYMHFAAIVLAREDEIKGESK